MARHNEIGKIGENIACIYLEQRGYRIIERNFRVYYGEIDVIAEKDSILHIIEVKTVSRDTLDQKQGIQGSFRPEDNMHPQKMKRLYRAIEIYLSRTKSSNKKWQLDLVTVIYSPKLRQAKVNIMEII